MHTRISYILGKKQLRLLFLPFLLLFLAGTALGDVPQGVKPEVQARAAVVMDCETGEILYEKNPDVIIPPASLTKLMTIHVTLKQIEHGVTSRNAVVQIPVKAYAYNQPPHSSLMFLGPNQKVTVGELLKGLAVASGNDAAVAIAHHVAGSVEDFVYLMNREATRLGLDSCTFHDPAGLSAHNTITARDFAEFCKIYIELHPETLQELHSVKKITYPTKENITADYAPSHVTQYNRNRLLWEYPEVDGLKTGYIHESGYNIAVSAKKNGMRLVAVLLGGNGRSSSEGQHNLARDAKALLDYSFNNYITLRPRHTSLPSVRVWKGKESAVELAIEEELTVTISKQLRDRLETSYNVRESVEAPVEKGDPLGEIVVSAGDKEIKRVDLIASQAVERGNFFKRLRDTILLLF